MKFTGINQNKSPFSSKFFQKIAVQFNDKFLHWPIELLVMLILPIPQPSFPTIPFDSLFSRHTDVLALLPNRSNFSPFLALYTSWWACFCIYRQLTPFLHLNFCFSITSFRVPFLTTLASPSYLSPSPDLFFFTLVTVRCYNIIYLFAYLLLASPTSFSQASTLRQDLDNHYMSRA